MNQGAVRTSRDHWPQSADLQTSQGSPGTFSAAITVAGVRTMFSDLNSSEHTRKSPVSVPQGYRKIISGLQVPSYGHLASFLKVVMLRSDLKTAVFLPMMSRRPYSSLVRRLISSKQLIGRALFRKSATVPLPYGTHPEDGRSTEYLGVLTNFTKWIDDRMVLPVAVRYSYDNLSGHSREIAEQVPIILDQKQIVRTSAICISALKVQGDPCDV